MLSTVFVSLLLVFVLFTLSKGDNCCGESDCSDSCPWAGTCNSGRSFSCMRKLAEHFTCRDESACREYDKCDDHAIALRTGQICKGFPYYNGGYPLDPVK